jgi:hypothetical protein
MTIFYYIDDTGQSYPGPEQSFTLTADGYGFKPPPTGTMTRPPSSLYWHSDRQSTLGPLRNRRGFLLANMDSRAGYRNEHQENPSQSAS